MEIISALTRVKRCTKMCCEDKFAVLMLQWAVRLVFREVVILWSALLTIFTKPVFLKELTAAKLMKLRRSFLLCLVVSRCTVRSDTSNRQTEFICKVEILCECVVLPFSWKESVPKLTFLLLWPSRFVCLVARPVATSTALNSGQRTLVPWPDE